MLSAKPLYVQQPQVYVVLGVTTQTHLSGAQRQVLDDCPAMPPGGNSGLCCRLPLN